MEIHLSGDSDRKEKVLFEKHWHGLSQNNYQSVRSSLKFIDGIIDTSAGNLILGTLPITSFDTSYIALQKDFQNKMKISSKAR